MGGFDNATWQALGLLLTLVGLGLSAMVWVRRGPVSGLRAIAWSLLPLAAGLTGVLRLGWDIADSVGRWAVRLVFSPVVWLGLVVAAVSAVLFVVTGFLRRRRPARPPRTLTRSRAAVAAKTPAGGSGIGDMGDIEEILRKHGIS